VFKSIGVGALLVILAACGAPRPRHAEPPNPDRAAGSTNSQFGGKVYRVDEGQSELRVLVYRAGPLARFGHNHVVVNRALGGAVNLGDGAAEFRLNVPAAGFVVDDAQARREEGADFAAEVPDEAKSGTTQNMQGTAVLDAAEFPMLTINSIDASVPQGTSGSGSMITRVAVNVAGHESKIDVPVTFRIDSNRLFATGSFEVRQSALGLTPYSLMLGALQVQDAMTIKFKIVAVEAGTS
jgi:YceI-like domain